MDNFRITHIHLRDNRNLFDRIESVRGPRLDGKGVWTLRVEDAVLGILENRFGLFVHDNKNQRVNVIVVDRGGGNYYLRTEADTWETNNLLSLPQF